MAHALCMQDNWGYIHTIRICNTSCVSAATMVSRTRLIVAVYIYCLSYYYKDCVGSTAQRNNRSVIRRKTHKDTVGVVSSFLMVSAEGAYSVGAPNSVGSTCNEIWGAEFPEFLHNYELSRRNPAL